MREKVQVMIHLYVLNNMYVVMFFVEKLRKMT